MATVPLLDDDTIEFGDEELNAQRAGKLKHPYVTFFHLVFRGAALLTYILCGLFGRSFIASFVFITLLLSMDFWTVKNVTGRLMVGLRWWNYVDDEGKSHWVFEARKQGATTTSNNNDKEAGIFWTALIATPIIWGIMFIVALFGFNFKWLLLVIIALTLNTANLYGYLKCKFGKAESITSVTTDFIRNKVMLNAVSLIAAKPNVPTTSSNNVV